MKHIKLHNIAAILAVFLTSLLVSGCPKALQYHGMLPTLDLRRHVDAQPFSFVAMAGSGGKTTQINTDVLVALADDAQFRNANTGFMVFGGGMINGSAAPQVAAQAMQRWQETITSHFELPILPVIGGNEVRSKESEDIYRQFFGSHLPQNGPSDERGTTYYFDYNKCRFIILTTSRYGKFENIDHIDWLENTLKTARPSGINHIFVFGNSPCWPVDGQLADALPQAALAVETQNTKPLENARTFWNMLREYKVVAYICGDEHVYARQKVLGVWQIVSGSCGAELGRLNPSYPQTNASNEEARFEKAKQYYQVLGYPHDQGKIPQAGAQFVGKAIYHYCLFDVTPTAVRMRTYGDPGSAAHPDTVENIVLVDDLELVSNTVPLSTME